MRFFVLLFVFSFSFFAFAADGTEATDNSQSVLSSPIPSTPTPAPTPAPDTEARAIPVAYTSTCCTSPTVAYKGKDNVAPCAVQKSACLSYCQRSTDACCNTTTERVNLEVPICAPPCASKESVTRSRDGKRAVYDYGRYEAVLKVDNQGNVDVRYRKRLLDR